MSAGIRRLCLAYDVESYSGRGTRGEYAAQSRLTEVLAFAFREAGLSPDTYEVQPQGDGGIALLPTGGTVDEPRLLVSLIRSLCVGLEQLNADLAMRAQIRLRLGLGVGVVHRAAHGFAGPAVIEVCRLRDAAVVRQALAGSRSVLVAAVADNLYQDVLAHGYHGLPGSAFSRVEVAVKAFKAVAWLYQPGIAEQPRHTCDECPVQEEQQTRSALDGFLGTEPDVW